MLSSANHQPVACHLICVTLVSVQGGDEDADEEEVEEPATKRAKKETKAAASADNPNKGKMSCTIRGGEEAPKVRQLGMCGPPSPFRRVVACRLTIQHMCLLVELKKGTRDHEDDDEEVCRERAATADRSRWQHAKGAALRCTRAYAWSGRVFQLD